MRSNIYLALKAWENVAGVRAQMATMLSRGEFEPSLGWVLGAEGLREVVGGCDLLCLLWDVRKATEAPSELWRWWDKGRFPH